MRVKVFVLGLPGSGKSTVARYIEPLVRDRGKAWSAVRFNDYDILHEMFQADVEHKKFRPTEHGGFDVLDLSVFDFALKEVESSVRDWMRKSSAENELILIEFARADYCEALKQFSPDFLCDSSFLFLDVDISTCIQRIRERVAHPATTDDHFVSEYIFDAYYCKDNRQYMSCDLEKEYGIEDQRIAIIDNTGSQQDSAEDVKCFINFIITQEVPLPSSCV